MCRLSYKFFFFISKFYIPKLVAKRFQNQKSVFLFIYFFKYFENLQTVNISYRVDRFISLATLWDMLTAATLLGSVIPIIPLPLQEKCNDEDDSK